MTLFPFRRRFPKSSPGKSMFFLPESSHRNLRWRRHTPADDWNQLAPPPMKPGDYVEARPDFITLSPRGREFSRMVENTNAVGKSVLVLLALALLLIRIFC